MPLERLDKIIASQGLGSRKEIKEWVKKGKVLLGESVCKTCDIKIDPEQCEIFVMGKKLLYKKFFYILLNKKAGYITATEDKKQKTVLELLPKEYQKLELFPAGRLDKDTEGLLILTNDGQFSHEIMSPRHLVPKTYYAKISGELIENSIALFEKGLSLADGHVCLPAKLEILSESEVLVTISEGKYHQVKRMIAACGGKVEYLKRISIGNLKLDDSLKLGEFRFLSDEEVSMLRA